MTASKKYKLYSVDTAAGEKPVCAFFGSPAGCKNGDNCKFLHTTAPANTVELSEDSSVPSSESEGENDMSLQDSCHVDNGIEEQGKKHEKQKKKRKAGGSVENDIFANPKSSSSDNTNSHASDHVQKNSSAKKKLKQTYASLAETPKSVKTEKEPSQNVSKFNTFVSKLPVASFSIPDTANNKSPSVKIKDEDTVAPAASPTPTKRSTPKHEKEQKILPTSTAIGRKWQQAVIETRKHERYNVAYDSNRAKANDEKSGIQSTWIKAKPYGSWCKSLPQAIAVDCEMCETQDPLSGSKDHHALNRLSVVNAENPEEVLLDTLVKPSWPVTNYRTRINGITKEHLDKVEFTLRHAQAFMMEVCSQETVIVGHAVNNDLNALKMEHDVVVDSSFLFRAKDDQTKTPSLKDTVQTLFKKKMPETHDSVNDARKSLECALHWIEKDGKVDTIVRTPKNAHHEMAYCLFIHRIPKVCNPENLKDMFLKHTSIEPTKVEEIQFSGNHGKTHISFKSPSHANLAFDTLQGKAEVENSGRQQKKVFLRNGDYIRVRKMFRDKQSDQHNNNSKTKIDDRKEQSLPSP